MMWNSFFVEEIRSKITLKTHPLTVSPEQHKIVLSQPNFFEETGALPAPLTPLPLSLNSWPSLHAPLSLLQIEAPSLSLSFCLLSTYSSIIFVSPPLSFSVF